MTWTQSAILLYPVDALTEQQKDAIAQAFVDTVSLETFANERLMFEKALPQSSDYGATETHRAIHTALTPELASALKAALAGVNGHWYILDADTGELLDTNDDAKTDHGLNWQSGITVTAGELLRYNGQMYEVREGKSHTTQTDWTPDVAVSLFRPYVPPGMALPWRQPLGSHDAYPVGARVEYGGQVWVNALADNVWQPGVTGWTVEGAEPETYPAWQQPTGAHNDYDIGDRVIFNGQVYESKINGNVWSPTVHPTGWTLIGPA